MVEIDLDGRRAPRAGGRHHRVGQERAAPVAHRRAGRPIEPRRSRVRPRSTTRAAAPSTHVPHCPTSSGLVTDLDHHLGARALRSLEAGAAAARTARLRDAGADGLEAYRRAGSPAGALPRLLVVIDEFATLAVELPDFLGALVGIAQRGRSLGVHLVLGDPATVRGGQRRHPGQHQPADRAAGAGSGRLRRRDRSTAMPPPSTGRTPGGPTLRAGPGEPAMAQTALATARTERAGGAKVRITPRPMVTEPAPAAASSPTARGGPSDLDAVVHNCLEAARLVGDGPPRRPWIEMLPEHVAVGALDAAATEQPLVISVALYRPVMLVAFPSPWPMILIIRGDESFAGTSTPAISVCSAPSAAVRPMHSQPSSTPGRATGGTPVGVGSTSSTTTAASRRCIGAPHVGAVVGADERERRLRLVRFLGRCLDERRSRRRQVTDRIIVAIDHLPTLLADLDGTDGIEAPDELRRVLPEGPPFGADGGRRRRTSVGGPRRGARSGDRPLPVAPGRSDGCRRRWLPIPRAAAGGPGRGLHVGSRLVVQFPDATSAAPLPRESRGRPRIEPGRRPTEVGLPTIPGAAFPLRRSVSLPVGVGGPDLGICPRAPVRRPPAGRRRGPQRRRRRSAFVGTQRGPTRRLVVVVVVTRPSPLRDEADRRRYGHARRARDVLERATQDADRQWVVVVDDAHRVGEAPGLERLERSRHCRLVVGGRSDRLGSMFGHWTRGVRTGGMGVLLHPRLDADGDLLGVRLPRTTAAPMRAGRGFVVAGGDVALVQIGRLDGGPSPGARQGFTLHETP